MRRCLRIAGEQFFSGIHPRVIGFRGLGRSRNTASEEYSFGNRARQEGNPAARPVYLPRAD